MGVRLEFGLPWACLGFDWTPNSERLRFQVGLKSFKFQRPHFSFYFIYLFLTFSFLFSPHFSFLALATFV